MDPETPQDPELIIDSAFHELQNAVLGLISQLSASVQGSSTKALVSSTHDYLAHLRARIRDLEEFAEEQDRVEETERLILKVSQWKREYESLQIDLRKANLQMRRNAEQAAVDERKALLGSPDPLERQRRLGSEAELASAAQDITVSLQRTRQQMTEELEHTSATLAAMEVSDSTLKAAKDEFSGQRASHKRLLLPRNNSIPKSRVTKSLTVTSKACQRLGQQPEMCRSRQLLGTMRRHSILDFLTLWGGISMFLLVVIYIVSKRSLYFVPQFAKDLVTSPFRSKNAAASVTPSTSYGLSSEQPGKSPGLAAVSGMDSTDSQEDGDIYSASGNLTSSADSAAGLQEAHLSGRNAAEQQAADIERIFQEHSQAAEAQQEAAHPGGWSGAGGLKGMQAQISPHDALANGTGALANGTGAERNESARLQQEEAEESSPPESAATISTASEDATEQATADDTVAEEQAAKNTVTAQSAPANATALGESEAPGMVEALDLPEAENTSKAHLVEAEPAAQLVEEPPETAAPSEEAAVASTSSKDAASAAGAALQQKRTALRFSEDATDVSGEDEHLASPPETDVCLSAESGDVQCQSDPPDQLLPETAPPPLDAELRNGVNGGDTSRLGFASYTEAEYQEPESEVTTAVPEGSWMGSREDPSGEIPTTRQEDTELGIFRPDEV